MWLDLSTAKENTFEPLPKGSYNMIIDKAEAKTSGTGKLMVKTTFKVMDGEHRGRAVFHNFMLEGSEKSMQVTMGQLKALMKINEKPMAFKAPEELAAALIGCDQAVALKIEKSDEYGEQNRITAFKPKMKISEESGTPF